jgi:hypothetical protein
VEFLGLSLQSRGLDSDTWFHVSHTLAMSTPKDTRRLFDTRAIERNIKHGLITRDDVAKHLSSLPDVADKGVTLGEVEDERQADSDDRSSEPASSDSSAS